MAILTTQNFANASAPPVGVTHPLYSLWQPVWQKASYVVEGCGPFLDGGAIWPHPREWEDHTSESPTKPTKKLKTRRGMARYENVAKLLLTQVSGALFRSGPQRIVGAQTPEGPSHPISAWWEDVDGKGTSMSSYLRQAWTAAGTFGHVFVLMDRDEDDTQRLVLRTFTPLDAPDWLLSDEGTLDAIKFVEVATERTLFEAPGAETYRYRYLDDEFVAVARQDRTYAIAPVPHGFGRLPVVVLYTKRRSLIPLLGESVIGDPQLYYDLYNLTSEVRELLRNQTFGVLNVPLGTGDTAVSAEDAKSMMGVIAGTDQVLFTPALAAYLQPDTANVEVYQTERERLMRTIYRLAAVPWEGDSRDAESADSRKVKRDDFNQQLAQYADELQAAERALVDLWFRGTYGPERSAQEQARAQVLVRYPDRFDADTLDDVKSQASLLTLLAMPYEVRQAVQTRALTLMLPDATPQETQKLQAAVEAGTDPAAQQMELLKMAQTVVAPRGPVPPKGTAPLTARLTA